MTAAPRCPAVPSHLKEMGRWDTPPKNPPGGRPAPPEGGA